MKTILVLILLAVVCACSRTDPLDSGGMAELNLRLVGMRESCIEINQEFDRILRADGVRLDCGTAPNAGDGDAINSAFGKIESNLALVADKETGGRPNKILGDMDLAGKPGFRPVARDDLEIASTFSMTMGQLPMCPSNDYPAKDGPWLCCLDQHNHKHARCTAP